MDARATRRRLRTLAGLELVNVVWLPAVVFVLLDLPPSAANVVGAVAAVVLLVEGAGYWLLKGRQLQSGASAPSALGWFAVLRQLNVALLVGAGLVVLVGAMTSTPSAWVPGLVLWLLAVAEQVNYFHVQLMHDTRADLARLRRRGLRRSHLAADLRRAGY